MANTIGFTAIAPLAGYLSDLIGRRHIAIASTLLVILGMAIYGTAKEFMIAAIGSGISGVGQGIAQVVGLAGVAELVPVRSRGKYLGTIYLGFCPGAAAGAYSISPIVI
jgi:predicted MFS family arabinose efflux permease